MSEWAVNSNEALTLSLVRASEDKAILGEQETYENFHPNFTYPIFGEDEKIYGYSDLIIDLRFTSGSLAQYLNIKYSRKLSSTSTVDDPEATLKEFIPPSYYTSESDFKQRVEDDAVSFKPLGDLIHSYKQASGIGKGKGKEIALVEPTNEDAVQFEIYHATWDTPGFKEYHSRMQLFILLYIEAGSYINDDEDSWEFFVLYENRIRVDGTPTYHFAGYSSLYNFYHFPEKTRLRLSQFVIPSPYQRKNHGSELYNAIYNYAVSKPHIAELTVEDPAEAFEDLRDKNDLKMLLSHPRFLEEGFGSESVSYGGGRVRGVGKHGKSGRGGSSSIGAVSKGKLGPPTDKVWAENFRKELKIASRQFNRLVEMLILLKLDPTNRTTLRAYRLQVKERLYRFNYEILVHLEKKERLEKLQETFDGVIDDYQRILSFVR